MNISNFPLIIRFIADVHIVNWGMISMMWLENRNIISEDKCIMHGRGNQNGCRSGRHWWERDSCSTRYSHSWLISSWNRWSGIFELTSLFVWKGSLFLKLSLAKIHGAPREMMMVTSFVLLFSEEKYGIFGVYSLQKVRFTPQGINFVRKFFLHDVTGWVNCTSPNVFWAKKMQKWSKYTPIQRFSGCSYACLCWINLHLWRNQIAQACDSK